MLVRNEVPVRYLCQFRTMIWRAGCSHLTCSASHRPPTSTWRPPTSACLRRRTTNRSEMTKWSCLGGSSHCIPLSVSARFTQPPWAAGDEGAVIPWALNPVVSHPHLLLLLLLDPFESVQRFSFTNVVLSASFPLCLFHPECSTDVDTGPERFLLPS